MAHTARVWVVVTGPVFHWLSHRQRQTQKPSQLSFTSPGNSWKLHHTGSAFSLPPQRGGNTCSAHTPCTEVATANFPSHEGWTLGLLRFSHIYLLLSPTRNEQVYISSSHLPLFHWFFLRLITNYVYFMFIEKPHMYKYFIFCLQM